MFDPPGEFQFDREWDEALARADLIGWEPSGQWCALFSIEHWGSASKLMERDDGDREMLRALPLRSVVAYRGCDYLWSISADTCSIWQTTSPPPLKTDGQLVEIGGTKHARADIIEVRSFDDDQQHDWHGVEVALRDGSFHRLALMLRLESAAWAVDLARSVAAHFSVPYRHVVPPGYKAAAEAKKRESDKLTTQLLDGLIDAYDHWDDPDRVAAREQREAWMEKRNSAILVRSYIESGQRRICAWDRDNPTQLTIVEADRTTDERLLRVIERRRVAESEHAAVTATLRERGDITGATYRRSLVYWVIDKNLCAVWRRRGDLCALSRAGDDVEVGKRSIPVVDIRAVVAFRVPERAGHRGLALELVSGEHVLVEEDKDSRYDEKVFGGNGEGWNVVLAREVATALGVAARETIEDVIVRPAPRQNPALDVIAACGKPTLAKSLTPAERVGALSEGRVLCVYSFGWSSMGDSESHAAFRRRDGAVEDADLVFERAIPAHIEGSWPGWEAEADVYEAFGVDR